MWFVAIVTDLFLVFDEISNIVVAHKLRSRTKTDQLDVPLMKHEKEKSVVNPRGPLRFISLFLLDHYYVIFEIFLYFRNSG